MSHHMGISWWSHWPVIFPVVSPERWVNRSQGNCSVWPHQNGGLSHVYMPLLIIFLRRKARGQQSSYERKSRGTPYLALLLWGPHLQRCGRGEVHPHPLKPYVPESEVSLCQGLSEISSPSVFIPSENSNWDIPLPSKFLSLFSCIRKFYINTKFYN